MKKRQIVIRHLRIHFWEVICDFLIVGYYAAALFVPSLINQDGQMMKRFKAIEWAAEKRYNAYSKQVKP